MYKILFVCHGNICRSPMAEYLMRHLAGEAGLADRLIVASAGTSSEEEGNPVYPPARAMLARHGIACDGHAARQMTWRDYDSNDMIIGMDDANVRNIERLAGGDSAHKIHRLLDFTDSPGAVADPWYSDDFARAWHDIDRGCRSLLAHLIDNGMI